MYWILHQMVLGLHILLAIIWVGGLLFIGWGVFPAIRHFKFIDQRQFLISLMKWSHHFFTIAGVGVIMTGVVLGTLLGPIKQWEDIWNTTFGNLWATAFIVANFSLAWGVFVGYKQLLKVLGDDSLWIQADQGLKQPLNLALWKLVLIESVEPAGFVVLIMIMVFL